MGEKKTAHTHIHQQSRPLTLYQLPLALLGGAVGCVFLPEFNDSGQIRQLAQKMSDRLRGNEHV